MYVHRILGKFAQLDEILRLVLTCLVSHPAGQ